MFVVRCRLRGRIKGVGMGFSSLSHIDSKTNTPKMVDVGDKQVTKRVATAMSTVHLPSSVSDLFDESLGTLQTPKGPVFSTAIVAGVMAAKKTSELIPFCHPLPLDKVDIDIRWVPPSTVEIVCTVGCTHKTGVEMEALTGASAAALCVYDMCKAVSHEIVIAETKLVSKQGGKSDFDSSSQQAM